MLTNFKISLSTANLTKVLALCLVIPAYMNFFVPIVSKDPLFQFIGYLAYLVPIGILVIIRQIDVSKKFIIYWIIFSILLIAPSIINLSSGRLESDLINIKALFSKWIFLSALMFFFDSWFKKYRDTQWDQLVYLLFLFILPMMSIIFFEVITDTYECGSVFSSCRAFVFNTSAFITSELFLLFGLLCLPLKSNKIKFILLTLTIIALILLQARTALFATILALAIYTVLPLIYKYKKKIIIPAALVTLILCFYIFNYFVDNTFIGRHISTFTYRIHMWQLGLETIQASPWFGIGFDVTPNYYSFTYNHDSNTIHNMFIRIATENGLPLLIFITTTFIYSLYRVFQAKSFYALAIILSVIIFHSFSTRHVSINLLNIIFYFIIMRSFYIIKK